MRITQSFVLVAGGTGGHMVPAHALGQELIARGHGVTLITDKRGTRFPGLFEGVDVQVMRAGRVGSGPLGWLRALGDIVAGRRMAGRLYKRVKPAAVIGFGGYPALPALLAATARDIPSAIHEQNAVLGRTNRLLAPRVEAIATAYDIVQRIRPRWQGKVELVGNPVRAEVLDLRMRPAPRLEPGGPFRVLVTGGSQGATILSTVVPDGLAALPEPLRAHLSVVHQARPEDADQARARYAAHGIAAEVHTYLADMPERLAVSHLVIARAGASTIAELTAAGRPAILVPLPSAMDDHQTFNAREMAESGGARMIAQADFTPASLAAAIADMAATADTLAEAAAFARAAGRPDAVERLADLVERLGRTTDLDPLPAVPIPVRKEALA
ncbi:undecaprenyldiphospho-muramoylpentapeptide beta-N-acetylglucosaminyltransferase [Sphingomonas quercus]|uniref:UDP-N-acetylglucosamine--N-acetylmuramyl-(pentapeptide) pyrophosphoryl-undecaprenol N-acetylglucosamine transferase n=1 Tax=Sphingomonas quercus TaxID=2842451 RepID=A0ABS6BKL7_9SPHN|nr:undecaprenyldiphospho-muramoylpentapeptide beta-N-acetylglucosaminyltransferase [Sphingomonas quercus]MBU3077770.1 undecaprenyldiphospho-muramoylpentapeptide beta-N-acetylglucosaminyltransferase [Sphingomonas quercus]